ncbi:MAG: serine hydrolase domain-containing protein [Myxococcota bacterium]|nr:serine hydrolase domain-containing protein [Myxococcota bacterium]
MARDAGPGPWIDGRIHPDFHGVARALRDQLRGYPGGAAVCVYHEGECVVDLWGGKRDRTGRTWDHDTMAPSFSTTKGVASTLVHVMRDRGLLDYDDPVSRYWPGFAQAGKERITVRHVLAHQSGLYHIRQMIDDARRMLDWEYMVRAIERTEPLHEPGTRTGYHGLTYGFLVGELLRRVTGRSFPELVADEIVGPLGLDGMFVGAPEEALPRAAELVWPERRWLVGDLPLGWLGGQSGARVRWGAHALTRLFGLFRVEIDLVSMLDALAPRGIGAFDFGSEETLRASIPAANGLFTARALARMYAVLAGGGELDGVRLVSRETLAEATRVQDPTAGRAVLPFDMRWRLGYHGVATSRGVPRAAFGHFGFGGSGAWADPRRNLALGLIVNSGMGTPLGDLRIVRMGGAVLDAVARRPRSLATPVPEPKTPAPGPGRWAEAGGGRGG